MSGRWSAAVAALVIALRVAALDAAAGNRPETPRLAVVVNDYAGASPELLDLAKSHVTFIYEAAGVDLDWVDRDDPRLSDEDFLKAIVTVSLYSDEMADRATSQDDVVGKAPPGGRTAKILYQRLARLWTGRTAEASFLLANVIAHEIGHLVLPAGGHARWGLMAAEMSLPLATRRPLFFTPAQSRSIRNALLALAADD